MIKRFQTVINTRCTEHLLWTTSSALGVLVLVAQVPPIFLRNWVHIIEPRPINRTNDKGEIMVFKFLKLILCLNVDQCFQGKWKMKCGEARRGVWDAMQNIVGI